MHIYPSMFAEKLQQKTAATKAFTSLSLTLPWKTCKPHTTLKPEASEHPDPKQGTVHTT